MIATPILRRTAQAASRLPRVQRFLAACFSLLCATAIIACGGGASADAELSSAIAAQASGGSSSGATSGTSSGASPASTASTASTATAPGSCNATQSAAASPARIIEADPTNYLSRVRALVPGDTLILQPGTYDDPDDVPGLPLFDLNGTATQPIVITGPESGPRPVLLGRSTHNTVRLSNSSHVVVRNLEIDGRDLGGAGVAAQGIAHHIAIENLVIRGVGGDQQIVGISTVGSPTWNWIICGNTIVGAGTGMYLGNSDGSNPFVAGLIERNLIRDTIGYNVQIKHQTARPAVAGMPTTPQRTIIRHNVFSKSSNSSTGGMARPNLLVGHFPTSGAGTDDLYEIYGNFFHHNATEALFQGEGNIAFHSNILVNDAGSALNIQPHHDVPKSIHVFGNTILASGSGIRISGGAAGYPQRVFGNAVFAATPISGGDQHDNITGNRAAASNFLAAPDAPPGSFDAYPLPGALRGPAIDVAALAGLTDRDLDFAGQVRDWTLRGAYASEGSNPGWLPQLQIKP